MSTLSQTSPPLGFGAFKIGRNAGAKYPQPYDLPSEAESSRLLNDLLDLGCRWIDTAPAYGLSEERIGRAISSRRSEYTLSTKVGETFELGRSTYDYSRSAVRGSLDRSLQRLRTDRLDVVLIHSDGRDLDILNDTDVVAALREAKARGDVGAVGLSGKTPAGAMAAMEWADVLMIEYHIDDQSHDAVLREAARRGVRVLIKKGLASGRLPPDEAIRFLLARPEIDCVIVGGLNLDHFARNLALARSIRPST